MEPFLARRSRRTAPPLVLVLALAAVLALTPIAAASPLQEPAPEPAPRPPETAGATRPDEAFPRGEIVDPVVCRADPSMSYALYLPSSYDPARRWPVLFLLDARSRGRMVAELFRPAAERYGWVLLSSNDSASDSGWEKMRAPAAAIVADALERLAVDPRRLHLGGFSGTARAAGAIAINAEGGIAGVFLTGGGLPENLRGVELPFAIYAAAGTEDFNFQEIDALDEPLTERGTAHRIEIFDGQHTWPPEETATDALGWFEVQTMIAGTRQPDAGLAGELAAGWLAEAAEREREGDPIGAWRLYRATARDLSALIEATAAEAADPLREPLAEAEAAAARLAAGKPLDRALSARRRAVSWETGRRRDVLAALGPLTILDVLPPPDTGVQGERLIRQLQTEAEGDDERAMAARRVLGFAAAHAGFYLPRDLLGSGDYHRAAIALELAVLLRPENAVAWYNLACARARLGQEEKALDGLEQAIAAGYRDAVHMAEDPDLESLRGSARFRELVATLGGASHGPE